MKNVDEDRRLRWKVTGGQKMKAKDERGGMKMQDKDTR